MPKYFGHGGGFDGPTGDIVISGVFVGIKSGEEGPPWIISKFIEDRDKFLSEPMQKDREAFAIQVDTTGNPEGMGNFWWAANPISAETKPK